MLHNKIDSSNKQNQSRFLQHHHQNIKERSKQISRDSFSNQKINPFMFSENRKIICKKSLANSFNTESSNCSSDIEAPKHQKSKFKKLQDIVRNVTVECQNQKLRENRQYKNSNKYRETATSEVIYKFSEAIKKSNSNFFEKEKIEESKQMTNKYNIENSPKIFSEISKSITLKNQLEKSSSLKQLEMTVDSLNAKIQSAKIELIRKNTTIQKRAQQKLYQRNNFKLEDSKISQKTNETIKKSEFYVRSTAQFNLSNLLNFNQRVKKSTFHQTKQLNHNSYYVSEIIRAMNQKNSLAMHHLDESLQIIKYFSEVELKFSGCRLDLPQKIYYKNKKTLIFQLDSTLIYFNDKFTNDYDARILIEDSNHKPFYLDFKLRPYLVTMLKKLAPKFEIIIFTTQEEFIADQIIDFIDPTHQLIQHRLYNQNCTHFQTRLIKDLRIINRPLSQIVFVDSNPFSYVQQIQNGIPILPYYLGIQDNALKLLTEYLQNMQNIQDVREMNKNHFKLHRYKQFDNSDELIEQLYMNQR